GTVKDVLTSEFGIANLVRLAALAAAVPLLARHLAGRGNRLVRGGLLVLAAVAAFTWPAAGHPATSNAPLLTTRADVAHLGAVVVLGLAAALVQTTPARTANASTGGGPTGGNGIFSTTLNSKLYQLQLDIEPVQAGNNEVHLYAYTTVGAPLPVKEWKVSAA